MKRKSKIGLIGAGAMAIAAALAPTIAPAMNAAPQTQQQNQSNQRDAIQVKVQAPRPVEQRLNIINSANGSPANRFLNQRQYRKWMRQCPHMRGSKKFRMK